MLAARHAALNPVRARLVQRPQDWAWSLEEKAGESDKSLIDLAGKYGNVGPAEIERRLRQSADDLGKPGNDDFYGRGRVNALTAIQ